MTSLRKRATCLAVLLACLAGAAHAADFDLPGLDADSAQFAAALAKPFPAGGTPDGRGKAEARATSGCALYILKRLPPSVF